MTTFSNISDSAKMEVAIQMVIMDAIEKGHTDKNELIAYMQSEVFEAAVQRYFQMSI